MYLRLSPTPPISIESLSCPRRSPKRWGRSGSSSPIPAAHRSAALSTTRWRTGSSPTARSSSPRGCCPARSSRRCGKAAGGGSSTSAPAPPASRSPASISPTPTAWPRSASSRRSRARSPPTGSRSTRSPPGASRPSGSPPPTDRWMRRRTQRSRQVPAGRLGRPEEYGDLVAFLCSERAAYLTGAVIPLDGGLLHSAF